MNLISLLSSIAMAVGLAASLPQILRMLRTRSSGGQSVLGWGMGLITNLSMAYVNLFGFGAAALMASNVLSAALCVAAMLLILRFNSAPVDDLDQTQLIALRPAPHLAVAHHHHGHLANMPTTEFVALREAVHAVSQQRELQSMHQPELAHAA